MPYAGITIFLLFFGVSLLDALRGGHEIRAVFWFLTGVVFWWMDRPRQKRRDGSFRSS